MLKQIDFKKFIDINRIFEITPEASGLYLYLIYIFALMIFAAAFLYLKKRKEQLKPKKTLLVKYITLLLTVSLVGATLVFLRFESIPYLGSRLAMYLLVFTSVFWLVSILIYQYKEMPEALRKIFERQKFEKYLPQNKAASPYPVSGMTRKS